MTGVQGSESRLNRAGTVLRYLERGAKANISRLLTRLRPEDVAALITELEPSRQFEVFEILEQESPDAAGEVLAALSASERLAILEQLPPERAAGILERAPVDDAVFVVESLPSELQGQVLEHLDLGAIRRLGEQLGYPEGSAGRLMDPEYFALPETNTVREAIAAIQEKQDVAMIFYLYVVDRDGHLVGVTSLRQLLLARPEDHLADIMQRNVIKARVEDSQREVAELASRYDLLAIPVVDDQNYLAGIVTVDDVLDVLREEATDDLLKLSGSSGGELLYEGRTLRVAGLRLRAMLGSLVGMLATGWVLYSFQSQLREALQVLILVPLVMGIGGLVSSQAGAATLRVLGPQPESSGFPGLRRIAAVLVFRQLKVSLAVGLAAGGVAAVVAGLLGPGDEFPWLAAIAVATSVQVATLFGILLPLSFSRFGLDPAGALGPWLSAVLDVVGLTIYFGFARYGLGE